VVPLLSYLTFEFLSIINATRQNADALLSLNRQKIDLSERL